MTTILDGKSSHCTARLFSQLPTAVEITERVLLVRHLERPTIRLLHPFLPLTVRDFYLSLKFHGTLS